MNVFFAGQDQREKAKEPRNEHKDMCQLKVEANKKDPNNASNIIWWSFCPNAALWVKAVQKNAWQQVFFCFFVGRMISNYLNLWCDNKAFRSIRLHIHEGPPDHIFPIQENGKPCGLKWVSKVLQLLTTTRWFKNHKKYNSKFAAFKMFCSFF